MFQTGFERRSAQSLERPKAQAESHERPKATKGLDCERAPAKTPFTARMRRATDLISIQRRRSADEPTLQMEFFCSVALLFMRALRDGARGFFKHPGRRRDRRAARAASVAV